MMVCVVEYGDNIGTLRNIFTDINQAVNFAQKLISCSDETYTPVGKNKWYCQAKNEFVEIQTI